MTIALLSPADTELFRRRDALRAAEPHLPDTVLAAQLGLSEAELVALGCGEDAVRLDTDWPGLIGAAGGLGEVTAETRGPHARHRRTGIYGALSRHGPVGLVLGADIDLRLFFERWRFGFAVVRGAARSLRFFDAGGAPVHRIDLTPRSDAIAFARLVDRHAAPADPLAIEVPAAPAADADDAAIDVAGFRTEWDRLQDIHHFQGLLRRFRVGRVQGLRLAGYPRARPVRRDALRPVLEAAMIASVPVMVFVPSAGTIQIHSGPIREVRSSPGLIEAAAPRFALRIDIPAIDTAWVVAKPTLDGTVTSLELFDRAGRQIAMLFGGRKPGKPENPAWRAILTTLPRYSVAGPNKPGADR